jgi:hypothetical protein
MIDIIEVNTIYSRTALKLLKWAKDCKNRVKTNKLIKIAERVENKYRDKHKNIWGEVYTGYWWNPL